MWVGVIVFTLAAAAVSWQQYSSWEKKGKESEKRVFLGWMIVAWVIGVLLLSGVKFPTPTKPLFPHWK
jgi:hypothetical protein